MDFDIIIIGGGIHGAGVLQAAAAAGYSALLLEQYENAAMATSSRSSKLIHGGLRYLESGEIKLVYECLRERRLLLKNAPDLVTLKPFYIPVYKGGKRRPWQIRAGLSLYSLLAGLDRKVLFKSLPKNEWGSLSGLKQKDLLAVFRYADGQTDDAALTQAVLRSAHSLGAFIRYNTGFLDAERKGIGYMVKCLDKNTGKTEILTCHALVNAAGPWINEVANGVSPKIESPAIELVQGSHILLPGSIGDRIFYLEAPQDRRAVFVMPWKKNLMVGTTEQAFPKKPRNPTPSPQEIAYLLDVFNFYFPGFYPQGPASRKDLLGNFAGLRVLPKENGSLFSRSRETRFVLDDESCARYVAIYGGKLTSYRATAEQAIKLLVPQLPKRPYRANTRDLKLGS